MAWKGDGIKGWGWTGGMEERSGGRGARNGRQMGKREEMEEGMEGKWNGRGS
jgi:hypothetical protein